jgi:uncharacterized protein YceH (UPF0502 family)
MAEVHEVSAIESALTALATREDGPFVVKLPREPGRRDSRYAHLFSGHIEVTQTPEPEPATSTRSTSAAPSLAERVAKLEEQVAELMEKLGIGK